MGDYTNFIFDRNELPIDNTYKDYSNSLFLAYDLSNIDFTGSLFINSDFLNNNLYNCKFTNCDLSGAKFIYADLTDVTFEGADLTNCDINNCTLKNTSISKAKTINNTNIDYSFTSNDITSDTKVLNKEIVNNAIKKSDPISDITIEDYETVDNNAFEEFSYLQNITLGSSIKNVGKGSFQSCSNLNAIKFKSNEKYITNDPNTIYETSLTKIDSSCFQNCSGLKQVILPTTLKNIGKSAFQGCSNMNYVILSNESLNVLNDDTFTGIDPSCSIYVYQKSRSNILKSGLYYEGTIDGGNITYTKENGVDFEELYKKKYNTDIVDRNNFQYIEFEELMENCGYISDAYISKKLKKTIERVTEKANVDYLKNKVNVSNIMSNFISNTNENIFVNNEYLESIAAQQKIFNVTNKITTKDENVDDERIKTYIIKNNVDTYQTKYDYNDLFDKNATLILDILTNTIKDSNSNNIKDVVVESGAILPNITSDIVNTKQITVSKNYEEKPVSSLDSLIYGIDTSIDNTSIDGTTVDGNTIYEIVLDGDSIKKMNSEKFALYYPNFSEGSIIKLVSKKFKELPIPVDKDNVSIDKIVSNNIPSNISLIDYILSSAVSNGLNYIINMNKYTKTFIVKHDDSMELSNANIYINRFIDIQDKIDNKVFNREFNNLRNIPTKTINNNKYYTVTYDNNHDNLDSNNNNYNASFLNFKLTFSPSLYIEDVGERDYNFELNDANIINDNKFKKTSLYKNKEKTDFLYNLYFDSATNTISEECFSNFKNINSIIISDTIKKMESKAFENCSNLKEITWHISDPNEDNVTVSISSDIFTGCNNLKTIYMNNTTLEYFNKIMNS